MFNDICLQLVDRLPKGRLFLLGGQAASGWRRGCWYSNQRGLLFRSHFQEPYLTLKLLQKRLEQKAFKLGAAIFFNYLVELNRPIMLAYVLILCGHYITMKCIAILVITVWSRLAVSFFCFIHKLTLKLSNNFGLHNFSSTCIFEDCVSLR